MERIFVLLMSLFFLFSCAGDDSINPVYRQSMREFVRGISTYGKGIRSGFFVIPQNGNELLTQDGEHNGPPDPSYIAAIDGIGREDLFYGYDGDDLPTPAAEKDYMTGFLDGALSSGLKVLVTDYCWTEAKVDDAHAENVSRGYVSFAASHRELDNIPAYPAAPYGENGGDISGLDQVNNFLYLINPSSFANSDDFVDAIDATNFDLLIIDVFFEAVQLTPAQVARLKSKANSGSRLVIAYMSIGEAEDYRYYWQPGWKTTPPAWLCGENPDWPGNYTVRYWDPAWQSIILGNDASYLKKILDAGFDGVYLDMIDAFEYFE
jgi:cysteinyl-tRNA synthetase